MPETDAEVREHSRYQEEGRAPHEQIGVVARLAANANHQGRQSGRGEQLRMGNLIAQVSGK
jgi:hypothetical protein